MRDNLMHIRSFTDFFAMYEPQSRKCIEGYPPPFGNAPGPRAIAVTIVTVLLTQLLEAMRTST